MSGMSMMVERMVKNAISSLPPEVTEKIGQIGQIVSSFDARLANIERQQILIMNALGINPAQKTQPELTHEQYADARSADDRSADKSHDLGNAPSAG